MMVSNDGHWTGDVLCDEATCDRRLSQEKIKRRGLLERGWQCVLGYHFCADHHHPAEHFGPGGEEYVNNWAERQAAWRQANGLLPVS